MEAIGEKAGGVYMSAEAVARLGVNGMMKGRAEIVPGFVNKIAVSGIWAAPRTIVETIAERIYRKREPN